MLKRYKCNADSFLHGSTTQTFVVKCISGLLPTLDIMQTRWPHIYHRNTCQYCNMSAESMEHLITCHHLTSIWLSVTCRTLLRLMIDIKLIDPESIFNNFLASGNI